MKAPSRVAVPLVVAAACVATSVVVAVAAVTLPEPGREPVREPQIAAFEAAFADGPAAPDVVNATATDVDLDGQDLATEVSTARDGSAIWHWLQVADWLGFVGPAGYGTGLLTDADYASAASRAVGTLQTVSAAEGGYANPTALQAVAWALSRIGAPYVWGATGPSTFDCSGLMLRAYESVGIRLPRVSRHQFLVGDRVALETLVPGDMVFFAHDLTRPSSVHHVAMYIGGGQMVHAPYTGARVRVDKLRVRGLIGAVRMLPASGVPTVPPLIDIPGLPPVAPPAPTVSPSPSPTEPTPTGGSSPSPKPVPSGITPTLVGPTPAPTVYPTLVLPPITTYPTLIAQPPVATYNPPPPYVISQPPPYVISQPPPYVITQPPPIITGPIRP